MNTWVYFFGVVMNLENISLLSQKLEKLIQNLRVLKKEKSILELKLKESSEIIGNQKAEIQALNETIVDNNERISGLVEKTESQRNEIEVAQEKFQDLLNTIEAELGTEIDLAKDEMEQETFTEKPNEELMQNFDEKAESDLKPNEDLQEKDEHLSLESDTETEMVFEEEAKQVSEEEENPDDFLF